MLRNFLISPFKDTDQLKTCKNILIIPDSQLYFDYVLINVDGEIENVKTGKQTAKIVFDLHGLNRQLNYRKGSNKFFTQKSLLQLQRLYRIQRRNSGNINLKILKSFSFEVKPKNHFGDNQVELIRNAINENNSNEVLCSSNQRIFYPFASIVQFKGPN